MMIIIIIVIMAVIFQTFLCGWNLVLSFCFAEAAADNRPRWRRPASQINIFLVGNIAFIIMASEFEEKKPGKRSGAELWPSSGLGMGGPGAPGARLGGAGLSGAAVVGLKLTLSSKSVTLMRLMSPTVGVWAGVGGRGQQRFRRSHRCGAGRGWDAVSLRTRWRSGFLRMVICPDS